ncbi:unnamed protein product [Owenia fusiformis]|uniref:Uncharacterized protein n=1 Tax=Owenia fusiformis TaxID=6347 RepID=A0A8J1TIA9_OWEFU|nr:unnamed protein product [Owenia fusiformis]
MRIRTFNNYTMRKCRQFKSSSSQKIWYAFLSLTTGCFIGILLTRYGYVLEKIDVNVAINCVNGTKILFHSPEVDNNNANFRVPNIVHFIWFGKNREMTFIQMVSIMSAHKIQQPDVIMFHYDFLPSGKYWDELKRNTPLKIIHRNQPKEIFGQSILHVYHRGDIAKLQILQEFGGIYMDYDVIMVNKMNQLRRYDMVIGLEKRPKKFNAGIILSHKDAIFLKLWYESYRNNYRAFDWNYNCGRLSYEIYLERPDLLHVEPYKFTTPDWTERHLLFNEIINWREMYAIHLMLHLDWTNYTPETVKTLKNTFGEVVRNVYYGDSKVIQN